MNIALLGYGKMGKLIEQVAISRQHSIVAIRDLDRPEINFSGVDIAIDFSTPEVAFNNITDCLLNGVPVISGTTGWLDRYAEIVELCAERNGAFLYASNFSLGVNVFFALNTYLAKLMGPFAQYNTELQEIHHIHKLDKPSGTAITLAEDIIANSSYTDWGLTNGSDTTIPITSERKGEIPGTHVVRYSGQVDDIEIKHTAHSREGFARGALLAAQWVVGRKGFFGMSDLLGI